MLCLPICSPQPRKPTRTMFKAASQQQNNVTNSYSNHDNREQSETPPPLPPPPPQELLDGIPPPREYAINQPTYESSYVGEHHTSSTRYHQDHTPTPHSGGYPIERSPVPHSPGYSEPSAVPGGYPIERSPHSPGYSEPSPLPGGYIDPVPGSQQPRQMSALSNNLSELDQLLQDLNSAQFMAEVDKRNVAAPAPHMVNGGNKQGPPAVAPKPTRTEKRSSVDGLLDMLEEAQPDPPQSTHYSSAPVPDHYDHAPHSGTQQYIPSHVQHNGTQEMVKPQAASTATKELDDLMATLSGFKVSNNAPQGRIQQIPMQHGNSPSPADEPNYAKPVKSRNASQSSPSHNASVPQGELENMMGNLQEDMKNQGVTTKAKGTCGACNQPVVGQVITALGKIWHIEHFVCGNCNLPLGTKNFYERDGGAYCEECYHRIFAPKCAYCNGPIVDKCVTALDMTWHPDHFFCAQCGNPFGDDGFHEKDGKAYCRICYLEMFAPRCGGCGKPILDNYISALNRHWHPECFVCRECHMPFGGRSFFDHEGQPYCETHYHLKRGSLCASCQKPITGRCITAMYKKFHPEHFVCAFCLKQLNKGTFKEQNDKPYCHPCFVKLFG
ncbi:hypothetical protein FSP39_021178 [Pinctada imbricata]|uniref:LIM zinc-binding domain-containing protein n=1 Tax=Pinctada imbricata TaxID=66713 RepID=A0AA89BKY0_PINIB|nr:hypothetical protein FSP39_021178 [Pinctada imbricata]